MIGLLIQENAYEQDIRELLMSFYPGEAYAHEVKEDAGFYVETKLGEGQAEIRIWDRSEQGEGGSTQLGSGKSLEKEADGICLQRVFLALYFQLGRFGPPTLVTIWQRRM